MQKNGRHQSAAQTKGFYIILTVCAIAIAISGYVLFFAPISNEASMDSVEYVPDLPQTTWEPDDETQSEPTVQISPEQTVDIPEEISEPTEPVISEQPEAEQTAAQTPVWVRPVEGEVSQAFSGEQLIYQKIFGDWRAHIGTDYSANAGDRVYAVANGEVTDITNDSLWGSCVTIKLSDERTAIYRGLDKNIKVKSGSKVSAGDVIGTVSNQIAAEADQGAHLHFELLDKDLVPTDPEKAN